MFDFFEWGEMLVSMLSELGDFLLHKPFQSFINAFRVIDYIDIFGVIPSSLYDRLFSAFDFTVGELFFTSMVGVVLGVKLFKFFCK